MMTTKAPTAAPVPGASPTSDQRPAPLHLPAGSSCYFKFRYIQISLLLMELQIKLIELKHSTMAQLLGEVILQIADGPILPFNALDIALEVQNSLKGNFSLSYSNFSK
ncbi:Inactive N-acetylated-alpha-linked acidic dipeptidase-like protein 2 [Camelus dromedarius]|uniref:Inactive N-acetylated-alpha-linked acidic dipeptidase-like protein 2 n=1 Tax=Camelus dromedarius TaxID=9838 RepID=A0A5N4EK73_CAMDR|nr:Inactive N-acetylated-alpha-linked acidic dipeptidase-like protein 2 [Camelus dromedarius]